MATEMAVVDAEEAYEVLVSLNAEPRAWMPFRVRPRVTWHARTLKPSPVHAEWVKEAEEALKSAR